MKAWKRRFGCEINFISVIFRRFCIRLVSIIKQKEEAIVELQSAYFRSHFDKQQFPLQAKRYLFNHMIDISYIKMVKTFSVICVAVF
jgi:hypothetical protein